MHTRPAPSQPLKHAWAQVVVSFYLPDSITAGTCHTQSGQTGYYKARNVSAWDDLPGAQATQDYCFLSALDVTSPGAEGALVALGASITDNLASTPDTNRRWGLLPTQRRTSLKGSSSSSL